MAKRIFDTSYLISHWKTFPEATRRTTENMRAWADEFIAKYGSRLIVTPVYIEMVAGVTSSDELKVTQAYLGQFVILDEGNIPKGDWDEAKRIAQRVAPNGGKRHFGDCLVRAIANRFNCDVIHTLDRNFPGR